MTEYIEQLWATQSTTNGALPIIQAASPGIANNRPFMEQVSRYLSYAPPPGYNPQTMHKDDAPISLSFFILPQNGERILLHKSYTQQATSWEPGTYFIHMLTNLPAWFSAKHAMLLWRSPFWQQTIEKWNAHPPTPGKITSLGTVASDKLVHAQNPYFLRINTEKLNLYLSSILHAHFLQLQRFQNGLKSPHLYIIATPDEVAYLFHTLLDLIPRQLQNFFSFSTYEYSMTNNPQDLLVGTCALSTTEILTHESKAFFLDYATGEMSRLPHTPLWLPAYYARYSARCYIHQDTKKLDKFLKRLEAMQNLNFASFSKEYQKLLVESKRTPSALSDFLAQPAATILRKLAKDKETRASLIDCALIERGPFLVLLTQKLALITQNNTKKGIVLFKKDISDVLFQAAETNNMDFFAVALSLLESFSPTIDARISLLYELIDETQAFNHYWDLRVQLLQIVYKMFEENEQEMHKNLYIPLQLLKSISLEDLPRFLALNMPPEWIFMPNIPGIGTFPLNMQDRLKIEEALNIYGADALRNTDSTYTETALALFKCVIYNGCMNKLSLMFSLLGDPANQPVTKETLEEIFTTADITSEERKIFSEHYRTSGHQPSYIALYPDALCWQQAPTAISQPMPTYPPMPQPVQSPAPIPPTPQHVHSLPLMPPTPQPAQSPALVPPTPQHVQSPAPMHLTPQHVPIPPQIIAKPPVQPPPLSQPPERPQPAYPQATSIEAFLLRPTFTVKTMWNLASMIKDYPGSLYTEFIESIAKALVECIEDAFQLSIALSTIGTICESNYSRLLLQEMVVMINARYTQRMQRTSEPSPELQRERLILAAYTQYTLEFIIFFYENDQSMLMILLHTLLRNVDAETFDFLDDISATWPSTLQKQWQEVEAQLRPAPIQPLLTGEVDYLQFVPSDMRPVYKDERQQAVQSMQAALSNKKGATRTLATWLRHRITLNQHKNDLQPEEWQHIEAASAFSTACQQANSDPKTEQAIIKAADHLQDNLTKREQKRVKRAKQNATKR